MRGEKWHGGLEVILKTRTKVLALAAFIAILAIAAFLVFADPCRSTERQAFINQRELLSVGMTREQVQERITIFDEIRGTGDKKESYRFNAKKSWYCLIPVLKYDIIVLYDQNGLVEEFYLADL